MTSLHSSHPEQSKLLLSCPWPLSCPHLFLVFKVLPRVSWMVSSSSRWVADTLRQEGTPAMTHSGSWQAPLNTVERRLDKLHHILLWAWSLITLWEGGAAVFLKQGNRFVENIMLSSLWLRALNLTFTCSSDCQEESCESAIHENIAEMNSGWKHTVFFSKGLGGSLPLSKLRAGHILEAAADRMQSIFLSVRPEPHPVPLSHQGGPYCADHLCSRCFGRDHSSGQEHASPQSAVFSRCAIPLCLVMYNANSLAPGSSAVCGANLDSHTLAKLSLCKCKIHEAHF